MNIHDRAYHYFLNQRGWRSAALEYDFARVLALGYEADDLRALRNHQGADFLFGHALERVENRGVGLDAPNIGSFNLEDVSNRHHGRPPFNAAELATTYITKWARRETLISDLGFSIAAFSAGSAAPLVIHLPARCGRGGLGRFLPCNHRGRGYPCSVPRVRRAALCEIARRGL